MYPTGSRTTNWSTSGHVKRSTGGRYKKSGTASSNFAYGRLDINDDGLDEFFLGESGTNEFPCVIYDIYTVVDGKIVHLFCGGARNRMYFTDTTNVLLNEWSNGADSSWSQYVQLVNDKLKPVELVRPAEKVNYELAFFLK